MGQKRLEIPPETVIEYFLENGYLEETDSYPMYRIAMNPDTFRIYSITELTLALAKKFHFKSFIPKSSHNKAYERELYKCLNEYQIQFDDRLTKCNEHWQFKMTARKWLEHKMGIDLEIVDKYDLTHKGDSRRGSKRWQAYWRGLKRKYSEEDALRFFKEYFDRRMQDPSKDLKVGRKGKRLPIAHKEPSKDVKEVDLNRPTSDENNVLKPPESLLDVPGPVIAVEEKIAEN